MATYVDILKSEFPEIDSEVFDYITGVLASGGADFEDGEEVYDAIGGVLQGVSADSKNEDDVREICFQMFNTLTLNNHHGSQRQVLLDAPVQLSQISADNVTGAEDVQGIWMMKRAQNTTVDAKKLEKAEAKLKAKHERRNEKDSQKPTNPLVLEEASASQASNKKDNRVDQSGKNRSYDIRIENFDVAFGERCLLQGAELSLATGRRYGLIGRNGLGKTTLLKMLASRNLRVPAHISILHVEQEVAGDDTRALQSVLESDTLREGLLGEEKRLNARIANGTADGMESVRLSEIYAKLEEIEADKAPARASVILAGLGFSPRMQQQTTKEFSGGWRMRLALARALFARPDLLLLDEPTNMLDVRAILWLENYLQTWQSTILVVSHDRNFLNAVVTDIIHLHSQRLDSYRGDYENFIKTKEDRLKNQHREYEAQLQYRQHIQVLLQYRQQYRYYCSTDDSTDNIYRYYCGTDDSTDNIYRYYCGTDDSTDNIYRYYCSTDNSTDNIYRYYCSTDNSTDNIYRYYCSTDDSTDNIYRYYCSTDNSTDNIYRYYCSTDNSTDNIYRYNCSTDNIYRYNCSTDNIYRYYCSTDNITGTAAVQTTVQVLLQYRQHIQVLLQYRRQYRQHIQVQLQYRQHIQVLLQYRQHIQVLLQYRQHIQVLLQYRQHIQVLLQYRRQYRYYCNTDNIYRYYCSTDDSTDNIYRYNCSTDNIYRYNCNTDNIYRYCCSTDNIYRYYCNTDNIYRYYCSTDDSTDNIYRYNCSTDNIYRYYCSTDDSTGTTAIQTTYTGTTAVQTTYTGTTAIQTTYTGTTAVQTTYTGTAAVQTTYTGTAAIQMTVQVQLQYRRQYRQHIQFQFNSILFV
uniref:ABC transporter domain-containing protein n=1 Tax=Dicentrarchus labrax TaxID=13489 RepID=A0A8P4G6S1_DICLA